MCSGSHRDPQAELGINESPDPRPPQFSVCRAQPTEAAKLKPVCACKCACESVSGVLLAPWGQGLYCLLFTTVSPTLYVAPGTQ